MIPPAYFEAVRGAAARRWEQLEADPDLAAPWHQLFMQVQSPRHVLSELLQNADDAEASEASVDFDGDEFVFSHDGKDFVAEDFASLCRFGYSNKRALHTIGFRGVGFKSTFSLGAPVSISTSTLSVRFTAQKFTLPAWAGEPAPARSTVIRVPIADPHRRRELEKNLVEWQRSAASLLFFRRIRRLRILGFDISWQSDGDGPVPNSEWMILPGDEPTRVLVIRSGLEEFPADALHEIRNERMMLDGGDATFPPSRVEIVLGAEGRLFVVLPTGVKTDFPFAVNAPFVQDPARLKIKDPDTSPTNRWLLGRVGELAATAMLQWLGNAALSTSERAEAYGLLASTSLGADSLESSCARQIEASFHEVVRDSSFLLGDDECLYPRNGCIAFPHELFEIWSPAEISESLNDGAPLFSRVVDPSVVQALSAYRYLPIRNRESVASALERRSPPKPKTWRQVMRLWAFIAPEFARYRYYRGRCDARIVPVHGSDVLHPVAEVVRLGEKRLLQSQDDWDFLSRFLKVLNQNFTRFITEQRRIAEQEGDGALTTLVRETETVLSGLLLADTSDVGKVFEKVAAGLEVEDPGAEAWIRAAQLAAALSAQVPTSFRYLTRDDRLTPVSSGLVIDPDNALSTMVDPAWYEDHAVGGEYMAEPASCSRDEWRSWLTSERSRLRTFIPLTQQTGVIWGFMGGRAKAEAFLRSRGAVEGPQWQYKTHDFVVEDWDFDDGHWSCWKLLAETDSSLWGRLLSRMMTSARREWAGALSARVQQRATTGSLKSISTETLIPAWVDKFRSLPCLQDTRGTFRVPAELLMRTPATEWLLDVEPFVAAELDVEACRPLLKLLGVRDTATGAGSLLDRIRALSHSSVPLVAETEKWYRRLDGLLSRASTAEVGEVRDVFEREPLIITDEGSWASSTNVFLTPDADDVPGAATVHHAFRDLSLWHRTGVGEKPSVNLAISWLQQLDERKSLSADDLRRVRLLLQRHPHRIWDECGHWLTLEGNWVDVRSLRYALTMQTLTPWNHLFPHVRREVADLRMLTGDVLLSAPFLSLPLLSTVIRESERTAGERKRYRADWMNTLGQLLTRIQRSKECEQDRLRRQADRLRRTEVVVVSRVESTPMIDGIAVGTPRLLDAAWSDELLFVVEASAAKVARGVTTELARHFDDAEVTDAIKMCYDRPSEFTSAYVAENFGLDPEIAREDSDFVPNATDIRDRQDQTILPGVQDFEDNYDDPAQDQIDDNGDERKGAPRRHRRHPLIQRVAHALGYAVLGDRLVAEDGSTMEPDDVLSSVWNVVSTEGEVIHSYWASEQSLERGALIVPAEIWLAVNQQPARWSMAIIGVDHHPRLITGTGIVDWVRNRRAELHPATYRLVVSSGVEPAT